VNLFASREPDAYGIVSRFVTRETSSDGFRYELAGLWLSHDGPFLRTVQHLVAQSDPEGEKVEELRYALGALMSACPPPKLGAVGRLAVHREQVQRGIGRAGDATTTVYA
jgi:hypothetical protein